MKPENKSPPIVFDTNALISAAILPNSLSSKALKIAVIHCELITSNSILDELEEVIYRPHLDKYFQGGNKREDFLALIARTHTFFNPQTIITDCSDPDDNKFLELAIDVAAPIIVSGDKHLLQMHPYKGIKILQPHGFLEFHVLNTQTLKPNSC
jgi:putative PIN family toxin of toxin-antitoxin system